MKKQIVVFFICLVVLLTSYKQEDVNKNNETVDEIKETTEKDTQKVDIVYKDEEMNLDIEDYVVGVVACEMPASFEIEALKAMGVAARTFALYKIETNDNYKLSTTTKDQCYIDVNTMKSRWGDSFDNNYSKIKDAVYETSNQKLTYNDKTIIAFYFSISNGYTENCENVFSQKLDYLVSVDSSWDDKYSYKEKTIKMSVSDFLDKLGLSSSKIDSIDIDRSDTGRAKYVTINNQRFKGTKFRQLLGLRSTDVDIKVNGDYVYINTKGYGHGVGMSQYGANEMAKEGYSYEDILKYYYTGVEISV